ncbi:MAG: hypothetical protein EOO05_01625 [Chitinophagaceae bacterium]|nr:MAG: hypothetical protein EOO05_01625 [Chitinophagaceae bacterium]
MFKNIPFVTCIICICCVLSCTQKPDEFRDFLNGDEVKYPGAITKTYVQSGKLRLGIGWSPSPDPSVTYYRVYWNNRLDSVEVPATTHTASDTIFTIIPNLQEYTYSFFVHSFDAKGNKSIPIEISNARVFGSTYSQSLLNRPINLTDPYDLLNDAGNEITLKFLTPDTSNTSTVIRYTSTAGTPKEFSVAPGLNEVTLNDYKYGTKVAYQSFYKPTSTSLDSFATSVVDTFPNIEFGVVECNKGLFSMVNLPFDVQPYEDQTNVAKLWDGSNGPQGYPNIFHSNGNSQLPHHFTMDMGQLYDSLRTIEVTGRNCCHNPVEFEIWGIPDITNAATTVPGNDAGWTADALSKGWILLKDVVRSDDGTGPYTLTFADNTPTVRYIRIRVKKVASGDNSYSNLSELTFRYKK